MGKLSEMRAFQAVPDAAGLTAAAAELRVSQSLVTRAPKYPLASFLCKPSKSGGDTNLRLVCSSAFAMINLKI